MGLFDRFKKKKQEEIITQTIPKEQIPKIEEPDIIIEDSDELLEIATTEILDTTSKEAIAKFKHNLKTLYKRLNETGTIEKIVAIRDDDFYPYDDNWVVASNNTTIEETNLQLSTRIRERLAIKQAGLDKKIGNISIPPSREEMSEALKKVDKNIASISMPAHFRSTKHFTINTPLGATGAYNGVPTERNFTIIDNADELINSGYTYSIAPRDAYLDVTHEPLKLSNQAIVMIKDEKYEKLKNNKDLIEQLKDKKVIIYHGDETLAIDMVLTQIGVIPTRVGTAYYEDPIGLANQKTEEKLKRIAAEKNILYDQSHGGEKFGHFTSHLDDLNPDWNNAIIDLELFLKEKFPNIPITSSSITKIEGIDKLIDLAGEEQLIKAIQEYNVVVHNKIDSARKKHIEERTSLPEDISNMFKQTVKRINNFYKNNEKVNYTADELRSLEEDIRLFFQAPTVEEQLQKASIILKSMSNRKNNELNDMLNDSDKEIEEERNYTL